MRYTGKIFHPPGTELKLDPQNLSPIQGQTAYAIYGQFKGAMKEEEFDAKVDASGQFPPILIRFRPVGDTAAIALFFQPIDRAVELQAGLALLSRLDAEEDERALAELQSIPEFTMMNPADWLAARQTEGPSAAAFFASETALNEPLIHGLMSLAGAAFFDRLGLAE